MRRSRENQKELPVYDYGLNPIETKVIPAIQSLGVMGVQTCPGVLFNWLVFSAAAPKAPRPMYSRDYPQLSTIEDILTNIDPNMNSLSGENFMRLLSSQMQHIVPHFPGGASSIITLIPKSLLSSSFFLALIRCDNTIIREIPLDYLDAQILALHAIPATEAPQENENDIRANLEQKLHNLQGKALLKGLLGDANTTAALLTCPTHWMDETLIREISHLYPDYEPDFNQLTKMNVANAAINNLPFFLNLLKLNAARTANPTMQLPLLSEKHLDENILLTFLQFKSKELTLTYQNTQAIIEFLVDEFLPIVPQHVFTRDVLEKAYALYMNSKENDNWLGLETVDPNKTLSPKEIIIALCQSRPEDKTLALTFCPNALLRDRDILQAALSNDAAFFDENENIIKRILEANESNLKVLAEVIFDNPSAMRIYLNDEHHIPPTVIEHLSTQAPMHFLLRILAYAPQLLRDFEFKLNYRNNLKLAPLFDQQIDHFCLHLKPEIDQGHTTIFDNAMNKLMTLIKQFVDDDKNPAIPTGQVIARCNNLKSYLDKQLEKKVATGITMQGIYNCLTAAANQSTALTEAQFNAQMKQGSLTTRWAIMLHMQPREITYPNMVAAVRGRNGEYALRYCPEHLFSAELVIEAQASQFATKIENSDYNLAQELKNTNGLYDPRRQLIIDQYGAEKYALTEKYHSERLSISTGHTLRGEAAVMQMLREIASHRPTNQNGQLRILWELLPLSVRTRQTSSKFITHGFCPVKYGLLPETITKANLQKAYEARQLQTNPTSQITQWETLAKMPDNISGMALIKDLAKNPSDRLHLQQIYDIRIAICLYACDHYLKQGKLSHPWMTTLMWILQQADWTECASYPIPISVMVMLLCTMPEKFNTIILKELTEISNPLFMPIMQVQVAKAVGLLVHHIKPYDEAWGWPEPARLFYQQCFQIQTDVNALKRNTRLLLSMQSPLPTLWTTLATRPVTLAPYLFYKEQHGTAKEKSEQSSNQEGGGCKP